jgi:hypothetical protein
LSTAEPAAGASHRRCPGCVNRISVCKGRRWIAAQHDGSVVHVISNRIEAALGAEMSHLMIRICVEPAQKAG